MKPVIYATNSSDRSEREIRNCKLARKICSEGIVLLENNDLLPIDPCKIALYGAGARHTVFCGTGSGENNPRYNINVEEGLIKAGFSITTDGWLDEYDRIFYQNFESYRKFLAKGVRWLPVMERMDFSADNPFYLPAGHSFSVNSKTDTDTAVYVLARQSGEGADRKDIPGDYYITEDERALMVSITNAYENTILVLNVGAVIDLSFLDEIKFSAVVLLMQGGMETGNALADVLTGKVNPSGRLADTWGNAYSDYPCHDTFSARNPERFQEDYREGIFAGYRWFDKKKITPRYPFGYGLSYTTFETEYLSTEIKVTEISVIAKVTNTGNAAGREVVMLYISCPENRLVREEKSLAAFAKTILLRPGESKAVTLTFNLTDHAGFDNKKHEFILESGDYCLTLNQMPVCVISLDEDAVTESVKTMLKSNCQFDFILQNKCERNYSDLPRFNISSNDIKTVHHSYGIPTMERSAEIDKIVSGLSVKDMAKLIVGRTYFGPYRHRVFGAVGYTTSKLFHKGIDSMPMADGPQGLNLTQITKKPRHHLFAIPTQPSALRIAHNIGTIRINDENEVPFKYYQFCTSWPSETMVAQTWDLELAKQQGYAIGTEMIEYGVVFWLAPAVNIHRNPLCGRNFEYYSEDPLLTGKMAAAVTTGVQSHQGCFATVKHFAANNLETKRNKSSSNLDERTLREIYLKAFRICVNEGHVRSVMCSYNKINGIYTALNYELQTDVLRNEWNFDGIVMTDWFATGHDESYDELCCKAGTDLIMPGIPGIVHKIIRAYRKGSITKEDIERSARRIIKLSLESHVRNN